MLFSICLAFSGFSTNTKYDPYQIKAEIASRRDRVSNFFCFVEIWIGHGEGRGLCVFIYPIIYTVCTFLE